MCLIKKYSVFIFDLDDTLYPELEYLKHAYFQIANNICLLEKGNYKVQDIYDFLINEFSGKGRENLFQKLLIKYDLKNYGLNNFLNDLRTVRIKKNSIKLFPEVRDLLFEIHKLNKKIYIFTNGNYLQQMNKYKSIDIPFRESANIIYASQNGIINEKPNPYYLLKIIENEQININEIIFIGDSLIDEQTAKSAGIKFMNVKELRKNNLL